MTTPASQQFEHTPLPWAVRECFFDSSEYEIYPTHGGEDPDIGQWSEVCVAKDTYDEENPDQARLNAELIVAAVNSHHALIEAAEQALGALKALGAENGHASEALRSAIGKDKS